MINNSRVQSCWYCTFLNQPDCKDFFFVLIEILVNQENENSSQILAERAG